MYSAGSTDLRHFDIRAVIQVQKFPGFTCSDNSRISTGGHGKSFSFGGGGGGVL